MISCGVNGNASKSFSILHWKNIVLTFVRVLRGTQKQIETRVLRVTFYLTKSESVKQKQKKQAGESGSPEVGVSREWSAGRLGGWRSTRRLH